jgi:DNA-binding response OmpR family regulator
MKRCATLVVDDDSGIQQLLQVTLRKHCSEIVQATDGERAAELLRANHFDVVVLDLMLPKMNGFEVAKVIESLPKPPKVIVLSGIARYFEDRFPAGAIILQKPFDLRALDEAMQAVQTHLSSAPVSESANVASDSCGNGR